MNPIRLLQIEALANSMRLRDIVRFCLVAPRFVLELLAHVGEVRAFYDGQIARLQADLAELRGRRSVEIEAAGKEGWRQAMVHARRHTRQLIDRGGDIAGSELLEQLDAEPMLALSGVYHAAGTAKPTEVTGELRMVGQARHGP